MFSLNFSNTFGNGSFYPDAGFKWTDRLNMVNEANFIFSSSSAYRRSQVDIGTIVSITEKDASGTLSQEFYGFIDDIQTVDGGGMNVHALGWEAWLGKQNGVYANSPWNNVSAVTIFANIIAETAKLTTASSDSFGNTYMTETKSDSLWNALMNLTKITGQDLDINYTSSGATAALKNNRCTGSYVSKDTFNSGKEIEDISVGRSFPLANSITVFGKGDGENQIKSDAGHGQDAGSQVTYGIIYKPVENYNIANVTAANQLADAEVAKQAAIIKTYQFTMKVKRYKTQFKAGDLLTLNSQDQNLNSEVVRITQIEKGMKAGAEYTDITVSDLNYSRLTKNSDMVTAQIQKTVQQGNTSNQGTTNVLNYGDIINGTNAAPLQVFVPIAQDFIYDSTGTRRVNSFKLDYSISPFSANYGTATATNSSVGVTNNQAGIGDTGYFFTNNGDSLTDDSTWRSVGTSVSLGSGPYSFHSFFGLLTFDIDLDNSSPTHYVMGGYARIKNTTTGAYWPNSTGMTITGSYLHDLAYYTSCLPIYLFVPYSWANQNYVFQYKLYNNGGVTFYNFLLNYSYFGCNGHTHTVNDPTHTHTVSVNAGASVSAGINATGTTLYVDYWNGSSWVQKYTTTTASIIGNVDLSNGGTLPDTYGNWRVRIYTNNATADLIQGKVSIKHQMDS